jgi:hypothetical protein
MDVPPLDLKAQHARPKPAIDHAGSFIVKNRLAFAGVLVLLSFVVLRASTINHANELFGVELKDARWGWMLELCGGVLIALSAASAAKTAALRDRGGG